MNRYIDYWAKVIYNFTDRTVSKKGCKERGIQMDKISNVDLTSLETKRDFNALYKRLSELQEPLSTG